MMLSTSKPLELLHKDLFDPTTYKSIGGNLYCLVIVDDFSRYTWGMFLGDKSETPEVFKTFTRRAQREYDSPIVKIRSDNDTEFKNMRIEEWCDEEGVKHEFSTTYMPQQNGVVERKNKTLITLARAMLDDYGTSEKFWAEAINTACHASNRMYLHRLLKRRHTNSSSGRSQTSPTSESLGANASFIRRKDSISSKVGAMKGSFLVMHQTPKHIEFSIKPPG